MDQPTPEQLTAINAALKSLLAKESPEAKAALDAHPTWQPITLAAGFPGGAPGGRAGGAGGSGGRGGRRGPPGGSAGGAGAPGGSGAPAGSGA
jgi:hypothetical protein